MGGAPLAFLNKKSWHTGGMKNRESVWKREQEHAEEEAKVKELQRQIEEEREREELENLAARHGGKKKKAERLDFMYNTPLASKALDEERDAYLLGEKKVTDTVLSGQGSGNPNMLGGEESQCERVTSLPSAQAQDLSRNENWLRLQNDPLFAIKRQQQLALEKIRKNPVKMQQLREEVKQVRGEQGRGTEGEERSGSRHHRRRHRSHRHRSEKGVRDGDRDRDRDGHRVHKSHRRSRSHRETRDAGEGHDDHSRRKRDRSRSPVRGEGYGLATTEAGTSQHSKGKFDAKQSIRVAEREQREKEAERERNNKAWSYGGKKTKHRVGRLSEDELRRKREAMMSTGQQAHQVRSNQTRMEGQRDEAEKNEALRAQGEASFIRNFQRDVYGANTSGKGLSLEESVSRRKFYSQR